MFDFVDLKTVLVIGHLLGLAIGVGGALMADLIFTHSARRGILKTEALGYIILASRTVWVGVLVLVLSGLALFFLDPERLMASTKFQAKVTIVSILILNGVIFHTKYLPLFKRSVDKILSQSEEFSKKSFLLFVSGAISTTSWLSALILGVLKVIPYSYLLIMSVYLAILLLAITCSLLVRKILLKG